MAIGTVRRHWRGVLIAFVAGVIAFELILRLVSFLPLSSERWIYDPAIGFHLRPSGETDAEGFNNPRAAPPPGLVRILFVGDSFTYGTYAAEASVPALAAARLAEAGHPVAAITSASGRGPQDLLPRWCANTAPDTRPPRSWSCCLWATTSGKATRRAGRRCGSAGRAISCASPASVRRRRCS